MAMSKSWFAIPQTKICSSLRRSLIYILDTNIAKICPTEATPSCPTDSSVRTMPFYQLQASGDTGGQCRSESLLLAEEGRYLFLGCLTYGLPDCWTGGLLGCLRRGFLLHFHALVQSLWLIETVAFRLSDGLQGYFRQPQALSICLSPPPGAGCSFLSVVCLLAFLLVFLPASFLMLLLISFFASAFILFSSSQYCFRRRAAGRTWSDVSGRSVKSGLYLFSVVSRGVGTLFGSGSLVVFLLEEVLAFV